MRSPTKQEIERFNEWMDKHHYTVTHLSSLTGWSVEAIYLFRRGVGRTSITMQPRRISEVAWMRWKRACAGLSNDGFDW